MFGLAGKRVLIAEDEYYLASDLAKYLRRLGAEVLGPVSTVQMAADFAEDADAAVLDINLQGEFCFPVADMLAERNVPFAFLSGYDSIAIPSRFEHVSFLRKPTSWKTVAGFLADVSSDAENDVRSLLPKLRLAARLIVSDSEAADRLVERTLELALREIDRRPCDIDLGSWLDALMAGIVETRGQSLLN
jgi:DNA-binding NtrC family response regulator